MANYKTSPLIEHAVELYWEGKIYERGASFSEYAKRSGRLLGGKLHERRPDLVDTWVEKGNENYWISRAWDPPFNEDSIWFCDTVEELAMFMVHSNWTIGTAFALGPLCFINQTNGGTEMLTMRGDVVFESLSGESIARKGKLGELVEHYISATDKQLKEIGF